jgi:hypothetical protein
MRISHSLAIALTMLAAPAAARAATVPPAEVAGVAAVRPNVATPEPRAPEMKLKEVRIQETKQVRDADAAMPARGSFWWLVGVIVVAGVILAVVL